VYDESQRDSAYDSADSGPGLLLCGRAAHAGMVPGGVDCVLWGYGASTEEDDWKDSEPMGLD